VQSWAITVNPLKFDLGWKLSTDKNIPPIWKKIMKFGNGEKNTYTVPDL
jgi:hypothetical protein